MEEELILPKLEPNDYLTKGYEFWKKYRMILTKLIKEDENKPKIEKTRENIIMYAKKIGIKPTARYFEITPSQVRYYLKKYDKK